MLSAGLVVSLYVCVCVLLTATMLSAGLVVSLCVCMCVRVLLTATMLSAGLVVSLYVCVCVLLTATMLSAGLFVSLCVRVCVHACVLVNMVQMTYMTLCAYLKQLHVHSPVVLYSCNYVVITFSSKSISFSAELHTMWRMQYHNENLVLG